LFQLLQALPLPRQNGLLQLVVGRLRDKSSQVRKNAIQLLIAMLQANPLAAQVHYLSVVAIFVLNVGLNILVL